MEAGARVGRSFSAKNAHAKFEMLPDSFRLRFVIRFHPKRRLVHGRRVGALVKHEGLLLARQLGTASLR